MFKFVMVPQLTFYLHVKPEKCLQRIQSRGRDCEKAIPVDYLQGLDAEYAKLMDELKDRGSKVVAVDWNEFQAIETICDRYAGVLPKNFDNYPKL
jgi:deoxyadenosine/deoxycytidine kinase